MLLVAMVQSSSDSIAMLFTSSFVDNVTFSILRHMEVPYVTTEAACCNVVHGLTPLQLAYWLHHFLCDARCLE